MSRLDAPLLGFSSLRTLDLARSPSAQEDLHALPYSPRRLALRPTACQRRASTVATDEVSARAFLPTRLPGALAPASAVFGAHQSLSRLETWQHSHLGLTPAVVPRGYDVRPCQRSGQKGQAIRRCRPGRHGG